MAVSVLYSLFTLCKGKKLYDKRDDMAAKDAQRDIQRALRSKNRGDD